MLHMGVISRLCPVKYRLNDSLVQRYFGLLARLHAVRRRMRLLIFKSGARRAAKTGYRAVRCHGVVCLRIQFSCVRTTLSRISSTLLINILPAVAE
jgi:hypothetical protein